MITIVSPSSQVLAPQQDKATEVDESLLLQTAFQGLSLCGTHDRARKYSLIQPDNVNQISALLEDLNMDFTSLPSWLEAKLLAAGELLESLHLKNTHLTKDTVQNLLEIFENAHRFSCKSLDVPALLELQRLPHLSYLEIDDMSQFKNDDFKLFTSFPKLKVLILRKCRKITEKAFSQLHPLRDLARLTIRGCKKMITDDGLRALQPFSKLQILELGKTKVTQVGAQILFKFPQLCKAELSGASLPFICKDEITSTHPSLVRLNGLIRPRFTNDALLRKFKEYDTNATFFCLESCQNLTDDAIDKILLAFPNLKEIEFHNCWQFTKKALASLIAYRRNLKDICLFGCRQISTKEATAAAAVAASMGIKLIVAKGLAPKMLRREKLPPSVISSKLTAASQGKTPKEHEEFKEKEVTDQKS